LKALSTSVVARAEPRLAQHIGERSARGLAQSITCVIDSTSDLA